MFDEFEMYPYGKVSHTLHQPTRYTRPWVVLNKVEWKRAYLFPRHIIYGPAGVYRLFNKWEKDDADFWMDIEEREKYYCIHATLVLFIFFFYYQFRIRITCDLHKSFLLPDFDFFLFSYILHIYIVRSKIRDMEDFYFKHIMKLRKVPMCEGWDIDSDREILHPYIPIKTWVPCADILKWTLLSWFRYRILQDHGLGNAAHSYKHWRQITAARILFMIQLKKDYDPHRTKPKRTKEEQDFYKNCGYCYVYDLPDWEEEKELKDLPTWQEWISGVIRRWWLGANLWAIATKIVVFIVWLNFETLHIKVQINPKFTVVTTIMHIIFLITIYIICFLAM